MKKISNLTCNVLITSQSKQSLDTIAVQGDLDNMKDVVLVNSLVYRKLFGNKTTKQSNYWKPQFLKISYNNRSIHRRVQISSAKGLDATKVGLTYNSIGELTEYDIIKDRSDRPIGKTVELSKGSVIKYWLRHPNPAAQVSFILGMLSIALGIIGIIVSIILSHASLI